MCSLFFATFCSLFARFDKVAYNYRVNSILLTAILLVLLVFLALSFYILLKIRAKYREIVDFVTPSGNNQPSQLAVVSEALSEMIGRAIVASLRGFLLGQKSIETRQANAAAGEEISASPIGSIVNMLPISLKKSLIKNPQLLDIAMGYLSRSGGSGGNGRPGGSGPSSQPKFNL